MTRVEELMGSFHCHYTVHHNDMYAVTKLLQANNIQNKLIYIDLFNKDNLQTQRDVMFTVYFHTHKYGTFENIFNKVKEIAELIKTKVNLIRYKVEHTGCPSLPITEENYFECHIELETKTIYDYEKAINEISNDVRLSNYRLSNNPKAVLNGNVVTFFLNTRIFKEDNEGDAFKEIASALKYITEKYKDLLHLCSFKNEVVIFDSNIHRDAWWMK